MKAYSLLPLAVLMVAAAMYRSEHRKVTTQERQAATVSAFLETTREGSRLSLSKRLEIGPSFNVQVYVVENQKCAHPTHVVPVAFMNVDLLSFLATALAPFYPGWKQSIYFGNGAWPVAQRYAFQFDRLLTGMKASFASSPHVAMDAAMIVMRPPECNSVDEINWASVWRKDRFPQSWAHRNLINFR